MLSLLLLPILLVFQPSQQKSPASGEQPPVVATYFRWFRDRQEAKKSVLPARGPEPPLIEPNKSIGRNQKAEGTAPERDPNAEKVEARSASLDQIAEQAGESARVDGFTYEVKFKNLNAKQAQIIFWEYQFKEIITPENTSRRRYVCGVKIKPDTDKLIQIFSTLGPSPVINVKNLMKGSGKQFDESVIIDRIEFEDGSVWQRKDWSSEEARFAVTKRDVRSGICRSF
jgi:hypothetical protein